MSYSKIKVRISILIVLCVFIFSNNAFCQSIVTQDEIVLVHETSKGLCKSPSVSDVYPNPASNEVTVVFNDGDQNGFYVTIYDLRANAVYFKKVTNSNSVRINISRLSSGTYYVLFESTITRCFNRMIVQ